MENNLIRIADFFAGIGGIRSGFEQASKNYKCVFSNEIDKYAIKTYEENFLDKVNTTDINELDTEDIPDFDIFLGGFPCQPFSLAGNQKGFSDIRGHLFFHIVRILKKKRPNIIFLENVKNLVSHDNGNTFKIMITQLTNIGYNIRYSILSSCKHGNIPQNRERIFIVGFLDQKQAEIFRFPQKIKLTKKMNDFLEKKVKEDFYYTDKSKIFDILNKHINNNNIYQYRRYYVRDNKSGLCPTLTANMGSGGHNVPILRDNTNRIRKLTPRECLSLQGFCDDYKISISNCHIYKQAGNSVTISVVKRIAKKIFLAIKNIKTKGDEGTFIISPVVGYDNGCPIILKEENIF